MSKKLDKRMEKHGWKHGGRGREFVKPGWFAGHVLYDNVYVIDVHSNYNGSGKQAFGGAKEWPVVDVQIAFEATEQAKAERFAVEIAKFVDTWLEKEKIKEQKGGDEL